MLLPNQRYIYLYVEKYWLYFCTIVYLFVLLLTNFDHFQKEKTHECPHCSRSFRHKGNLIRHMDLHDPDSTAKEKAIALKAGRQKKIQIIDGMYLIEA